jgi:hypothetical protein
MAASEEKSRFTPMLGQVFCFSHKATKITKFLNSNTHIEIKDRPTAHGTKDQMARVGIWGLPKSVSVMVEKPPRISRLT